MPLHFWQVAEDSGSWECWVCISDVSGSPLPSVNGLPDATLESIAFIRSECELPQPCWSAAAGPARATLITPYLQTASLRSCPLGSLLSEPYEHHVGAFVDRTHRRVEPRGGRHHQTDEVALPRHVRP